MLRFKITEGNTTYTYTSANGDIIRVMVKTSAGTKVFDAGNYSHPLQAVHWDIANGGKFLRCQGYPNCEQPSWEVLA